MVKGFLRLLLFFGLPLSILWQAAAAVRNALYDYRWLSKRRLKGFTISVGNVHVGGSGKTPMVLLIAQSLRDAGHRPCILSRGYRSGLASSSSALILAGQVKQLWQNAERKFPVKRLGCDEPYMLSALLPDVPVVIGVKRYDAAIKYLQQTPPDEAPTHWILDDGFQHRSLDRDLDIVVVGAFERQRGEDRYLLPLGRLRESWSSLKRADVLAVHDSIKKNDLDFLWAQNKNIKIVRWKNRFALSHPQVSRNCYAICHIAKPERFFSTLRQQGWNIICQYAGVDHQSISVERLRVWDQAAEMIITTEKDYYRDPKIFDELKTPVLRLTMRTELLPEEQISSVLEMIGKR